MIFTFLIQNTIFLPSIPKLFREIKQNYTLENVKEDSIIAAYCSFYWQYLDIDPTKTRPASEALIRRILGDKPIPIISPFVDAYNWASIQSRISLGTYDIEKIAFPLEIRFANPGEIFTPIGSEPKNLPLNALVLTDANSTVLCQYPYRDSQISMVTPQSHQIIVVAFGVPQIPPNILVESLEDTKNNLMWLQDHGIIDNSEMLIKTF